MSTALLGYTGFVGGSLLRQRPFDEVYNSKNIADIHGKSYDFMVIACAPAVKWAANARPGEDRATMEGIMRHLEQVKAERVLLISTVDVYPNPAGVDENTVPDPEAGEAYGRHRLLLERFALERFKARILRLPGLFGRGLKKNVIYDYLHNNQTERIDTRHVFQFYCLDHLSADAERFMRQNWPVLNMATEPVDTAAVAEICLGRTVVNEVAPRPVRYDMRSLHAVALGGKNGYIYSRAEVLEDLRRFVTQEKEAA